NEPFEFDLFPHNLQHLAIDWSSKVSGGEILSWLGMSVKPADTGVVVTDVLKKFNKEEFWAAHDRPPLDGDISYADAIDHRLSDEEFNRLDANHDGTIQHHEVEDAEEKLPRD